jgi:hypothetical protein
MPTYKPAVQSARRSGALGLIGPLAKVAAPKKTATGFGGVSVPTGGGVGFSAKPVAAPAAGLAPIQDVGYRSQIAERLAALGIGNQAGYVPESTYQGEITADPEYQLGERTLTNRQNELAQARANDIRQGFIKYGFPAGDFRSAMAANPNLAGFAGDIDAATEAAAAANQMSVNAQNARSLQQAQAALPYQLAARGAARSGAMGTRSSAYQQQHAERQSQALSSLLDQLGGTASTFQRGVTEAATDWERTKAGVTNRLAQTRGFSQPTQNWGLEDILSALGLGGGGYEGGGYEGGGGVAPGWTAPPQMSNAQIQQRALANRWINPPQPTRPVAKAPPIRYQEIRSAPAPKPPAKKKGK